jgi:hypothetical protein
LAGTDTPQGNDQPVTPDAPSRFIKMSVNITHETAESMLDLAARKDITRTEVLRRSVATQKFLQDAIDRGAKVLIKEGRDTFQLVLV